MRVALTGGAYQARSLIAGAQRCLNLIPEAVPAAEGEPAPMIHNLTPGLRLFGTAGAGAVRALYRANDGTLYACIGGEIRTFDSAGASTYRGTIGSTFGPVSMVDNGVSLLIVDGSAQGWTVDLVNHAFGAVTDPDFYGGNRVDVIDGFFILNRPGTNQFYLSNSVDTTFDPLDIAASTALDKVVSIAVTRRQAWILGERVVGIWQNTGAADFPLQAVSGGIEHGCAAAASVAKADGGILWLARDRDGQGIVLQAADYNAKRISTHAIEYAVSRYGLISDAVGWTYQQGGHLIYALSFPSADATWCYDLSTQLWHEWRSGPTRHRGACQAAFAGLNIVGDFGLPNLYVLDPERYDDLGTPNLRVRSFPHMVRDARRVQYLSLIADMQTGTIPAGQPEPLLSLRYSDDRGATWGTPVTQGMGLTGEAITSLQFQRLGMARDRVFELSWTAQANTALQGAWLQTRTAAS